MRTIPPKFRKQMAADPAYAKCARQEAFHDHVCEADPLTGRLIEWEHAWIYAGKQIIDPWATLSLCWLVHRGGKLNKRMNQFLTLQRATDEDLVKYPRMNWEQLKKSLEIQFNAR